MIGRVSQLTAEHIPSLVTRLQGYGVHSLQTRTILHLLQTRVNPAPFQIFAAGVEGADLVTVTAMQMTPDFTVLDVCGREDSACRRRLDSLLRSPELAPLWRRPLRVEFVAEGLAPVFVSAAEDCGLRRVLGEGETRRLYLRPDSLSVPLPESRTGVSVRPLEPHHLAKVQRFWSFLYSNGLFPDTDAMMRDSTAAGLSAGVFLTESAAAGPDSKPDQPVSWALVNSYGAYSFSYTEPAYRARGLMQLVLAELIRLSVARGLPCFGYTVDTNVSQVRALDQQGFSPARFIARRLYFATQ